MKIKVGDTVLLIGGKDKGREGKVLKVFPSDKSVVVEGLNMYKKHRKAMLNQPGGIVDRARPLDVSKVAVVCPQCKKPSRIGYEVDNEMNRKIRFCKKCGKPIDK